MKMSAMTPVVIKVMLAPLKSLGIGAFFSCCLIPAITTIAKVHPMPEPNPNKMDCRKLYSLIIINNDAPNIAQLTVMSGRNMPRELYSN